MNAEKFVEMKTTATGKDRASVELKGLKTLWFNTGTQCNLQCKNCYIESTPTNDRLTYITADEVQSYLKEIREMGEETTTIGLTGGEPFLNPHIISILEVILKEGFEALVLTNALRLINRYKENLGELHSIYGHNLKIRVSLDHHTKENHEHERGPNSFEKTMDMIKWLDSQKIDLSIAGRSLFHETIADAKAGYTQLLEDKGVHLDVETKLVIFPEMKTEKDVPEITTDCWEILGKTPDSVMCASERMIVKRKGEDRPVVMPCTLIAYDDQFVLGDTLATAEKNVFLNHRFCAEFCVLGGASCSGTK